MALIEWLICPECGEQPDIIDRDTTDTTDRLTWSCPNGHKDELLLENRREDM